MEDLDQYAEREALWQEYQGRMARHYGVSFEDWLVRELTESRKVRAQETARFLGVMMDARVILRDWAQRPLPSLPSTRHAGWCGCGACVSALADQQP